MLASRRSPIGDAVVLTGGARRRDELGLHDGEALADGADTLGDVEQVGGIEVVEDRKGHDDIEEPVILDGQLAHVRARERDRPDVQHFARELGFFDLSQPAVEPDHFGSVPAKLECQASLAATEVEHTKAADRAARQVTHVLQRAPHASVVARGLLRKGVHAVGQTHVVGGPWPHRATMSSRREMISSRSIGGVFIAASLAGTP
jgi:hypothetical protein